MSTEENDRNADGDAALFEADRELGRRAFEVVIAPRFPEFTELVHTGTDPYEPHLIYRRDDAFLIVETEISDPDDQQDSRVQKELPDGRWVERGTREYLLAGLQVLRQGKENDSSLFAALNSAVSENRVRYILVTVMIGGDAGKREMDSLGLAEFDL